MPSARPSRSFDGVGCLAMLLALFAAVAVLAWAAGSMTLSPRYDEGDP